jgi:hypothetical protein
MKKILAILSLAAAMTTAANAQELPNYPIHNSDDQMLYDSLATSWDSDSPTARQCALDRLKTRHITKTYLNLLDAFNSCYQKELDEETKRSNWK